MPTANGEERSDINSASNDSIPASDENVNPEKKKVFLPPRTAMWRATEAGSAWRITRRADGQGYAVGFAEAGSLDNGFVNTKIEKAKA